jgi:hypothetical protein
MRDSDSFFGRWIRPVLRPPFEEDVALDLSPVDGKSWFSLLWRRWRPALSLRLRGQGGRQQTSIAPATRRILWIYKGSPQVGDSLMDLSGRVLLAARGIRVDLCTDPHLAALYTSDEIFGRAFSDPDTVDASDYDLVILDSLKWRCIEAKLGRLRELPFVTMRGCFAGPEFNRTLFSLYRMKQLLSADLPADTLQAMARPYLFASPAELQAAGALVPSPAAIAFAIGGAAAGRTYEHWDKVVEALLKSAPQTEIVLLGSSNAIAMRDRIAAVARGFPDARTIDCVDRYTLPQIFAILQRCRLAISADGGLLHLAHAAKIPTVALFDRHIAPALRLTAANRSIAIQSTGIMSDIPPARVVRCIEEANTRWPVVR